MLSEKTSKPETRDIYAAYRQNFNRYFEEVEKNVMQCMDAVSQLQQEFILGCKNTIDNTVAFQQEMVTKSGLGSNLPQSYLKSINDATDEFVKTNSLQNMLRPPTTRPISISGVRRSAAITKRPGRTASSSRPGCRRLSPKPIGRSVPIPPSRPSPLSISIAIRRRSTPTPSSQF